MSNLERSINNVSLTLSQAKNVYSGLIFMPKEARRCAIPSNTGKV